MMGPRSVYGRIVPCLAFAIGLIFPAGAWAQFEGIDPNKWFPLELGNYWSYETDDIIPDRWVAFSERDTLFDGARWVFFKKVWGSGPSYGSGDVSLWDSDVGTWFTMTDDYYVLRSRTRFQSDPDTIPPTLPYSALTSTAAFDDTTFSYPYSPHPSDSVVVWIYEDDKGSAEDSTNLVLNVNNGYPPDAGGWGYSFHYKTGSDGSGALVGARVNGLEWGDQTTIDHAIVLARDAETPPESRVGLEVYPNPATDEPTLRITTDQPGTYLIEVFDLLGRRVVAERAFLRSGPVEVRRDLWSADWPSGVYFVTVSDTEGMRAARKVTLVR